MRAAVAQASEYGAFVAAHAHGAEGIKRAARAGVRSVEHGSLMDDEAIALMKERGVWLVADIYNGDYIARVGRQQQWPADVLRKNDETTEAIAIEGDALADLRSFMKVGFVMKGGAVYKGP